MGQTLETIRSQDEVALAAEAVPVGGTTGQVLAKASATDHDTAWVDQTGGSGGASWPEGSTDQSGATYTFVAADAGKVTTLTGDNAIGTVPAAVFAANDRLTVKAGHIGGATIVAGAGMAFDPVGDIVLELGQVAEIVFTSGTTADVFPPIPPATAAEAEAGTETAARIWSPARVREAGQVLVSPVTGPTARLWDDGIGSIIVPSAVPGSDTTINLVSGQLIVFGPLQVWWPYVIESMSVQVITESTPTGTVQIHLYENAPDGLPGVRINGAGGVCEFDASTAGKKTATSLGLARPNNPFIHVGFYCPPENSGPVTLQAVFGPYEWNTLHRDDGSLSERGNGFYMNQAPPDDLTTTRVDASNGTDWLTNATGNQFPALFISEA